MAAQGLSLRPPKDGKGGRGGSSKTTGGVQVGRGRWSRMDACGLGRWCGPGREGRTHETLPG